MRTIMLFSSLLLLTAAGAMAQVDNTSDNDNKTISTEVTVEGCLAGAVGSYTLTDYAGASYQLSGSTEPLKAHDGETLRVTGVVTSIVHVPGAINEGTQTQPSLSVISFKQVSAVCNDASDLP